MGPRDDARSALRTVDAATAAGHREFHTKPWNTDEVGSVIVA